jgi:beta-phosphoglucomutase-like phosphatase (HAD superfamily)
VGTAILDIDGTLVDTNYHHTLSWARAFGHNEIAVALWRIHRHIGMGGDQLVTAVAARRSSVAWVTASATASMRSTCG